ncbi:MAG: hypothetical protein JWL71_1282 [Acidobacteria bacterium]|nr:hypothetical protein [Acidobacteriota bacterium]
MPVLLLALSAMLCAAPVTAAAGTDPLPGAAVKAAFLYNFAKFTDWQAVPAGIPLVVCVVGDEDIAAAFAETVRGQLVGGHALDVSKTPGNTRWRTCHVLFIAEEELRRSAAALDDIKALPVLTVSDGKGFAQSGIIELYLEDGKLRFAINVDAAGRAGVHISSRLLGLARIVRDSHAP